MTELHVISLGAGVQSSAMALMASEGLIKPKPVAAIFADTGWEPQGVYKWLKVLEKHLSFPIVTVSNGNIKADLFRAARNRTITTRTPPFFVLSDDGTKGMLKRQCTDEYKIRPINRYVRKMLEESRAQKAVLWIGISTDEAHRAKPSRVRYITRRFPLLENGISRINCLEYFRSRGLPNPPKSSCVICPYHNDNYWRDIKKTKDWEDAVLLDSLIRDGIGGSTGKLFLHRSLRPLKDIDFGQDLLDHFGNECEGVCGV